MKKLVNKIKDNLDIFRSSKGFTLLELLVVVLIIGILAAIALPQYKLVVAKSKLSSLLPIISSIREAQEVYYVMHGKYTDFSEDLDVDLSFLDRSTQYNNVLIYDKSFMIDLDDGALLGMLRAAYCPGSIAKGNKNFSECAYHEGDYVYHIHYRNGNKFCGYIHTDLGTKVCNSFNIHIGWLN